MLDEHSWPVQDVLRFFPPDNSLSLERFRRPISVFPIPSATKPMSISRVLGPESTGSLDSIKEYRYSQCGRCLNIREDTPCWYVLSLEYIYIFHTSFSLQLFCFPWTSTVPSIPHSVGDRLPSKNVFSTSSTAFISIKISYRYCVSLGIPFSWLSFWLLGFPLSCNHEPGISGKSGPLGLG